MILYSATPSKLFLRTLTGITLFLCWLPMCAGFLDATSVRPGRTTRRRSEMEDGSGGIENPGQLAVATLLFLGGAVGGWEALDRIDRMKTPVRKPRGWSAPEELQLLEAAD
ncbi:hypothetical protein [Deinococcus peraridilitoris]|uniref:Uncharacterized protein n=1 Tax=Deinococcus peraridilitoris (strain DSM 19664 / LMG 22246 / CIP 109416 / KR-200) TaxID=937777 RepID=L0A0M5_DEIPD|nr:hypothetical protein [Deinococcus peraridilitoris]AFZ67009.1 hypothetical protein Deipe_1468 [Deinococcus peraridilitoris DSM 19664]